MSNRIARKTQARHANRDQRRKDAVTRNEVWATLTTEAKVKQLRGRPGNSAKQLKRLGASL